MMKGIVRNVGIALLVVCLLLTSCGGEVDDEFTELPLTPVFLIPQLNFELDDFIGEKVWVSGDYGDSRINGGDYGFLVTDFYMLLFNGKLPDHSCVLLDGTLPPYDMNGAEVLVYGEVKDFAETYDAFTVEPTPLITVEQYHILSPPVAAISSSDSLFDVSFDAAVSQSFSASTEAYAEGGGTQAKDCDRALILSGGRDDKDNHARFKDNVIMKYKKLRALNFTDEQIVVLYDNGKAINVDGTNITDAKASKQKVKETLEKFKNEMKPCCCTLAIFVTNHGTGYNQTECYHGARPALDPARESGKTYAENITCVDLRSKVHRPTTGWTWNGKRYYAEKDQTGRLTVYMRQGRKWVPKGYDENGDGFINETEIGVDINGDGRETDVGWEVSRLEARLVGPLRYNNNQWDTDGDGNNDVRARWDGTRYVLERLKAGNWTEMARDTNSDFIINNTDGGIDWDLDGDKNDQIGFHEGINLWGSEVLWDDELADWLKPLHDKGIHILVEMNTCFSGGFVNNLKGLVDKIVTYAGEDTRNASRFAADRSLYAADQKAFVGNLTGIDLKSWNAAFEKGIEADTAAWVADGSNNKTRNHHQKWETAARQECPRPTDHSKCYYIENEVFLGDYVYLEDQFGAIEAMVDWAWFFCNPVEKCYAPISNPDHHLTLYGLDYQEEPQTYFVEVDNEFGTQELTVSGPIKLGVPTQKVEPGAHEPPVGLDHFLLYNVIEGPSVDVVVGLNDQFGDQPEVLVTRPAFFANPVQVTHGGIITEIEDPETHLVFYEILGDQVNYPHVQVVDQFGEQTFAVYEPYFLAVPSEELSAE